MGFYYRKSVSVGPFRVNLGSGGVGWSVGAGGLRSGVSGAGRRYSTFSIPGTGVRYTTGGKGCLVLLLGTAVIPIAFWLVLHLVRI